MCNAAKALGGKREPQSVDYGGAESNVTLCPNTVLQNTNRYAAVQQNSNVVA